MPPPPPHASKPPARIARKTSRPSLVRLLRPRTGMPMPKSRTKAKVVPPAAYQRTPGRAGYARAPLVAAVVEMVRVAVPALPVIITGLVEPKLNVGRSLAPVGMNVIAAVRATLPVKPPLGVTVIVEVLPVVAPGATETAVPLSVKLGGGTAVSPTVEEML